MNAELDVVVAISDGWEYLSTSNNKTKGPIRSFFLQLGRKLHSVEQRPVKHKNKMDSDRIIFTLFKLQKSTSPLQKKMQFFATLFGWLLRGHNMWVILNMA